MRYFTLSRSKLGMGRDFSLSHSFPLVSVAPPYFFQLMSCVRTYLHPLDVSSRRGYSIQGQYNVPCILSIFQDILRHAAIQIRHNGAIKAKREQDL
jgi:hypothetical protein